MSKKRENHKRLWTPEDVEYLLDNYGGNVSLKTLAKRLKRSEKAIVSKYRKLTDSESLLLATYDFTTTLLLEGMGVTQSTINKWVEVKGLPYTTITKSYRSPRKYNPTAFFKWVRENKEMIDFKKCTEGVLLPEPKWFVEEIRKAKLDVTKRNAKWTDSEIKRMLFLVSTGMTQKQIAGELNRTRNSIERKLRKLRDIS